MTDAVGAMGNQEMPAGAPNASLTLVYDLAIRSYDYTDRRYDLIGTRAGALIGAARVSWFPMAPTASVMLRPHTLNSCWSRPFLPSSGPDARS